MKLLKISFAHLIVYFGLFGGFDETNINLKEKLVLRVRTTIPAYFLQNHYSVNLRRSCVPSHHNSIIGFGDTTVKLDKKGFGGQDHKFD